jgi:hypothetical protein
MSTFSFTTLSGLFRPTAPLENEGRAKEEDDMLKSLVSMGFNVEQARTALSSAVSHGQVVRQSPNTLRPSFLLLMPSDDTPWPRIGMSSGRLRRCANGTE